MDSLANPTLKYDPIMDIQGLISIPWPTLV